MLYGKGMKGQNATLMAYYVEKNETYTMPLIRLITKSRHNTNTSVIGMSSVGMDLLQIGNPKEH